LKVLFFQSTVLPSHISWPLPYYSSILSSVFIWMLICTLAFLPASCNTISHERQYNILVGHSNSSIEWNGNSFQHECDLGPLVIGKGLHVFSALLRWGLSNSACYSDTLCQFFLSFITMHFLKHQDCNS
jgi:hypothetical protein